MKEHEIKAKKYANNIQEISNTLEKLVWKMVQDLRKSEQRYQSIVEFAAVSRAILFPSYAGHNIPHPFYDLAIM